MTLTLKQSLPVDPRVEALPIRQDLKWEIQKYLGHPTADLVKSNPWKFLKHPVAELVKSRDFVDTYRSMLYDRAADEEVEHWEELPAEVRELARQGADLYMQVPAEVREVGWNPISYIHFFLMPQPGWGTLFEVIAHEMLVDDYLQQAEWREDGVSI